MYRIMLVDDEVYIVDGHFSYLQSHLGDRVEIIKAYDGSQALAHASNLRIDLVISDINMPGTDGFGLLKEFSYHWPGCRFIFLTGYASFDYAYRALQHGNLRFLLKSEGVEALLAAVKEAIADLDRERTAVAPTYATRCAPAFGPYMEKWLGGYDGGSPPEAFAPNEKSILVMACLDEGPKAEAEQQELLKQVEQSAQRFFQAPMMAFSWLAAPQTLAWVIQPQPPVTLAQPGEGERMRRFCQGMLEALQTFFLEGFHCSLSFAVTDDWIGLQEIKNALPLLKALLRRIRQADLKAGPQMIWLPCHFLSALEDERLRKTCWTILHWLYRGDSLPFQRLGLSTLSDARLQQPLSQLIASFGRYNQVQGLNLEVLAHFTPEEMLWQAQQALAAWTSQNNAAPLDELITAIHSYIGTHLDSQLTLTEIAAHVHMNPSYLSRYYKKQCGENLFDYIMKMRLHRARQLLLEQTMKVSDVALLVGFSSLGYFSAVFKKAVGVSPQDYRRAAQIAGEEGP